MIRLRVPGKLNYRDVAIRAVAAACRLVRQPNAARRAKLERAQRDPRQLERLGRLDLSDPFDALVVSAFSEVFNNLVIHGYSDEIEIELEPRQGCLVLRLRDQGACFDISSVPQPDLDALPEGGLGLYIVEQCVDEFSYEGGPPNVWTLTSYLDSSAAA